MSPTNPIRTSGAASWTGVVQSRGCVRAGGPVYRRHTIETNSDAEYGVRGIRTRGEGGKEYQFTGVLPGRGRPSIRAPFAVERKSDA